MYETLSKNIIETKESKEARLNKYWRDPNYKIEINGEFLTLKECYERTLVRTQEIFEKTKQTLNEQIPEGKFILYVNQTKKGMMASEDINLIDKDRLEKLYQAETGNKEKSDDFQIDNIKYCLGIEKEDSRFKVFNSYNTDEEIPDLNNCIGMVFSGGEAYINGEDNPERIAMLEKSKNLIKESKKFDIPKLGICLGAQLLAHEEGAEVDWVKNEDDENERVTGMDQIIKTETTIENSFIQDFNEIVFIAQNHGQEIKEGIVLTGKILAKNEKGSIEVIQFPDGTICMQGHAEVGSIRMDVGMNLNEILKEPSYIFQNDLEKIRELVFPTFLKLAGAYNNKNSNN